ncbi:glycosyltransferase [Winogradskyella wichelsiae]|uniref:glycosyltransferase n=1 Tax=Winogradskyella wichelsiae TaxID=2697007 RepID=UPI0015C719AA|nr:glycosyltransferase [Winogradskyella wichelsiae]
MVNKISVIIPVYNVENYLDRCINSIINQTYQNFEIILVNDGSSDNSGHICDNYKIQDTRVIVIHKQNEGSSCARNAGLDIASGDYISFVDSDDYINESMLEIMITNLTKFNLDVVEINPTSNNVDLNLNYNFEIQDKVSMMKRIIQNTAFSVWRRMYKTSLINDLRFIPKIIHQDVFFTIDVLDKIDQIGYINQQLYHYNTDNVSIIRSKYSLEKIKIGIKATEYICNNITHLPELNLTKKNYVTNYYTDHYFLLSRNTDIDPNRIFRKKIRKAIGESVSLKNYTLRSVMVITLPLVIMEYISHIYSKLISRS